MKKTVTLFFLAALVLAGISSCANRHLDEGHSHNYWKTRKNNQNTRYRYSYPDHDPDHPRYYH
jgi:hypothetical protein